MVQYQILWDRSQSIHSSGTGHSLLGTGPTLWGPGLGSTAQLCRLVVRFNHMLVIKQAEPVPVCSFWCTNNRAIIPCVEIFTIHFSVVLIKKQAFYGSCCSCRVEDCAMIHFHVCTQLGWTCTHCWQVRDATKIDKGLFWLPLNIIQSHLHKFHNFVHHSAQHIAESRHIL